MPRTIALPKITARLLNAPAPRSRTVKGHAGGKCRHYQSDAVSRREYRGTDAAAVSKDQRMASIKAHARETRDIGASCKIHRTRRILTVFAGRSGRRSGRRGPELRDAEYLIDRECHHAEHEVAFDLDRAAHAHGPCAEFILQSGVDAFGQGAKIKNHVVRIGHMDEFHALDFFGPFGLGFVLGAKVAIDDRRMAERLAVVMDGGGVVGRIQSKYPP